MLNKIKISVMLVALLLLLLPMSCSPKEAESLTYVVIPAAEGAVTEEQFAPLIDYLSEELGREVELMVVTDYAAVVEALKYDHADFARLGTSLYVIAKDQEKLDIEIIAVAVKKNTGLPSYSSFIITRSGSGIEDLNGVAFAYADPGSTSGYYVPAVYMLEEGIELGETFFAGSQNAVIEAVKNGTVDAGAVASNRYYVALEEGVIAEGELEIIWESDPIFNVPVVAQGSMDSQLKESLRSAFLNAPREIVEHTGIGEIGFVEAEDSDYNPIRKLMEVKEQLEQ